MHLSVAACKAPKTGLFESGDQVQVTERARGGLSLVMVDGQGHGPAARRTAQLVLNRAVGLLAEGARDGAVARTVHDVLMAARDGKVSASLTIVTADLVTSSLLVSRNGTDTVLVRTADGLTWLTPFADPIGVGGARRRPVITEWPLRPGVFALALTDGVLAPERLESGVGLREKIAELMADPNATPATLVRAVLETAREATGGRSSDDMTAACMGIVAGGDLSFRRIEVDVPVVGLREA